MLTALGTYHRLTALHSRHHTHRYSLNRRTVTLPGRISGCLRRLKPILTLASILGPRCQKDLPMRSNTRPLSTLRSHTTHLRYSTHHVLLRLKLNYLLIRLRNGSARKHRHTRSDNRTACHDDDDAFLNVFLIGNLCWRCLWHSSDDISFFNKDDMCDFIISMDAHRSISSRTPCQCGRRKPAPWQTLSLNRKPLHSLGSSRCKLAHLPTKVSDSSSSS